MPKEIQNFLAEATEKAKANLIKAVESLPDDRRYWSPLDKGRSAVDQAAECAMLNGSTADIIASRAWPTDYSMEQFFQDKSALATSWEKTKALLEETTPKAMAAILSVADEDLKVSVDMPWGAMTLSEIMAYPLWNMSYHEGQTYYIQFLGDE